VQTLVPILIQMKQTNWITQMIGKIEPIYNLAGAIHGHYPRARLIDFQAKENGKSLWMYSEIWPLRLLSLWWLFFSCKNYKHLARR
jgi:hypothetical protein